MPVQFRFFSFTLLVIGLALSQGLFAQHRVLEEDVVYLKNGSIIRGQIEEQIPGDYVKIRVISDTAFTFQTSEIEKITREPSKYISIKVKKYKGFMPISYRQRGLYQHASFGAGFTDGDWGQPVANLSLNYRIGYHLNRFVNVGGGTGFDFYDGGVIAPFFVDVWGDLWESPVTPTYMANLGYGYGLGGSWRHDVFDGGLMGHLAFGLKFNTRSRYEYVFTVGYKRQDTYQEFEDWNGNWNPWTGQVLNTPVIKGTRIYQKIMWQFSFGF
ncbi:MAG: hypothetical protein R3B93_00525 [Bacteroidia bacterium]